MNRQLPLIAVAGAAALACSSSAAEDASAEIFGITPESPYLDIRIETPTRPGVINVTHVTISIGNESEDGFGIYVRTMEQADIAEVEIQWGRQVLEFFTDRTFVDE